MKAVQARDRRRLRRLAVRHPGLAIDPRASANLAVARFQLARGASLRIEADVTTERAPGAVRFLLEEEARVEVGAGSWLRTDLGPVLLVAFAGAELRVGPEAFLNACHLSAKRSLRLGRRVFIGPGSRVFDADQHDLDAGRPEQAAPVRIGDHVWIAADVTVLRGVTIGDHVAIGTRSLVTRDVPSHTLAFGQPATPRAEVGDRSHAR